MSKKKEKPQKEYFWSKYKVNAATEEEAKKKAKARDAKKTKILAKKEAKKEAKETK